MNKGCINMLKKVGKKGFTLVELLAVIVILAVVILIAITAVIPRMNSARKKALLDEALMYLNAAKESYVFNNENVSSCINVSNLNQKYIQKSDDSYQGIIKSVLVNGKLVQTINLTNGKYYVVGTDNLTSNDVKSSIPKGFATSCADYNPVIAENANTNTLAYKLLMSEGGTTIDDNLAIINQRSSSVSFSEIEATSSNSGIYKTEDDDGASFYYRGVVNNNWVEFGGFYWRIVRINGNGSIRLLYSGTKNSTHTGNDALIKNSANSTTSTFGDRSVMVEKTPDISGLTNTEIETEYFNGRFGNPYVGYMFGPKKIISTYPTKELSNSYRMNNFITYSGLNVNTSYYMFKNFDPDKDCNVGSDTLDNGTCTLKCRNVGDDCMLGTWGTFSSNYSTTADGVYPASNPTMYVYTSPFKYTCWTYTNSVEKNNSDGTKSVYISCPIVSEIVGVANDANNTPKLKYTGLFSPSEEEATLNLIDSNIKKENEIWYENNIYNKSDGIANSTYKLEDYISDELFCNDRTSTYIFPLGTGGSYRYSPYDRLFKNKTPTLKCPNISRDAFTLGSSTRSIVASNSQGNHSLKYPVGLITMDEASFAGGVRGTANESYYLNVGKAYFTLSPSEVSSSYIPSAVSTFVDTNGKINSHFSDGPRGIRPVINLKASVLYDSGSGTEADPYKVKLAAS